MATVCRPVCAELSPRALDLPTGGVLPACFRSLPACSTTAAVAGWITTYGKSVCFPRLDAFRGSSRLPAARSVPHGQKKRFRLQEPAAQDRLAHDQPVGVREQLVFSAVPAPGGLLHDRAAGKDAFRSLDPCGTREAHARFHEVLAREREHDVAFPAALLKAFVKQDVGSAGRGGIADPHVEPFQHLRDVPLHRLRGRSQGNAVASGPAGRACGPRTPPRAGYAGSP